MELQVMEALHKHLTSLGMVQFTLAPKSLVIGYKAYTFYGKPLPKFATLHGAKKYRCLVLHVDAGNPDSTMGKVYQKKVQEILQFKIEEVRKITLKNHEAYIPFEVIDSKEKLTYVKELVEQLFIKISEER